MRSQSRDSDIQQPSKSTNITENNGMTSFDFQSTRSSFNPQSRTALGLKQFQKRLWSQDLHVQKAETPRASRWAHIYLQLTASALWLKRSCLIHPRTQSRKIVFLLLQMHAPQKTKQTSIHNIQKLLHCKQKDEYTTAYSWQVFWAHVCRWSVSEHKQVCVPIHFPHRRQSDESVIKSRLFRLLSLCLHDVYFWRCKRQEAQLNTPHSMQRNFRQRE